ncbi:type IV pilus twitching motility protein PilT [Candidatus Peregrinibacteria bacterium]|nr:type IV pilus twitching motility protein PilT [Candidatus Peregrinibacteria bacterium]
MSELQKLFRTAYQYQASDLYITSGSKPILRMHGELIAIEEHPVLTRQTAESYILEVMNPDQRKRFEQTSDIDFSYDVPHVARFRVNIFVQRKGIGATFRLIPETIKSIDELGLPNHLKKLIHYKNGLILTTGPAGSGKSTTLAALLDEINRQKSCHILTIEDPIEFIHENKKSIIEQREVGTHTQSFHRALKAGFREDTNVILIGELRDPENFSLALTAAETGHLVLSSIHTSGAAGAVNRIIDSFPAEQQGQIRFQLSESLRAVIWQTLVKKKDETGRIAATEIMLNNKAISNLIRKGHTHQIHSIIETRAKEGMQSMRQSLESLVEKGLISQKTAEENMPAEMEMT